MAEFAYLALITRSVFSVINGVRGERQGVGEAIGLTSPAFQNVWLILIISSVVRNHSNRRLEMWSEPVFSRHNYLFLESFELEWNWNQPSFIILSVTELTYILLFIQHRQSSTFSWRRKILIFSLTEHCLKVKSDFEPNGGFRPKRCETFPGLGAFNKK